MKADSSLSLNSKHGNYIRPGETALLHVHELKRLLEVAMPE